VQAWHGGACLQSSFQEAGAGGLIMSVKPVKKKKREREWERERSLGSSPDFLSVGSFASFSLKSLPS
jgi:hypothetical protein